MTLVLLDGAGCDCFGEMEGVSFCSFFKNFEEILLFSARLCIFWFPKEGSNLRFGDL